MVLFALQILLPVHIYTVYVRVKMFESLNLFLHEVL